MYIERSKAIYQKIDGGVLVNDQLQTMNKIAFTAKNSGDLITQKAAISTLPNILIGLYIYASVDSVFSIELTGVANPMYVAVKATTQTYLDFSQLPLISPNNTAIQIKVVTGTNVAGSCVAWFI